MGQRQDDARFLRVVVPLEELIRRTFADSRVAIVVPTHAVPTGTRWNHNLRLWAVEGRPPKPRVVASNPVARSTE